MGTHKGWRVSQEGKTWSGWARDLDAQRYRRRRGFATRALAASWAAHEHAQYRARMATLARTESSDLATAYISHLQDVLKRTPSHLANVRRCLDAWAAAVPEISDRDAPHQTEQWLARLDVAAATRVQYRNTIVALGNWAMRKGKLPRNPMTAVEVAPVGHRVRAQYTVDELRAMVAMDGDRYHLAICLLVYCGLRIGELVGLAMEDCDLAGRVVRVVGKGRGEARKQRLVPIPGELHAILADLPPDTAGPLCPEERCLHVQIRHFQRFIGRVNAMRATSGLPAIDYHGRGAHGIRHSYAGIQTAMGTPSLLLASYMGHASMNTTAGYARAAQRYRASVVGWDGEMRLRL